MSKQEEKRPLRILIVSPNPLVAELGASQMAINLADALRSCGVDVVLWAIPPCRRPSWRFTPFRVWQKELAGFVLKEGPFDVIDAPAQAFTRQICEQALCVARSVQPHLSYLWLGLRHHQFSGMRSFLWFARNCLAALHEAVYLLQGWSRANLILCLGSRERRWMENRFPFWKAKLNYYRNAISREEQIRLAKVRVGRMSIQPGKGIHFLWVGRWVGHKGTDLLVAFIKNRLTNSPLDSFTIAGCGTGPYQGMPEEWKRNPRLRMIPHYARADLPDLLANHELGLFTSLSEGWGLSLNEMLESGMPVYATDAGGVDDLKPYLHGLLQRFPPDGIMKSQPDAKLADWEVYYRHFSWDSIADHYLKLVTIPKKDNSARSQYL